MRHCESPDACKWPRCGCIEGLGAIQNVAGRDATQRGKSGSLVDVTSLSATSVDPVKELADHVAFYADSWPVYEPGYVASLATRLRELEGYKKAWEDYVSRIVAIDDAALTKEK